MARNGLIKSFEKEGILLYNVIGMIEDDNKIIFYLDEDEKINAFAIECMKNWGYDSEEIFEFQGIDVETNEDAIRGVADEWYIENYNIESIERSIKVIFNK